MAKVNIGPLADEKGDVITGNEKMAEVLKRYFVSVFTVEDTNNIPKNDDRKAKAGEDLETIIITKDSAGQGNGSKRRQVSWP